MSIATDFSAFDELAMAQALRLAHEAIGLSDPNPRVGCVIAGEGWQAQGFTQPAGEAHAEVMALRAAQEAGHDPRGATAYVTLEPCAHHGRTPPCCDALVEAGLARVVVAVGDPNPLVAGQGLSRLRAAGIRVEVGLMADQARELNIGFFSRQIRQRPWVRMKIAASLDGRTALANGVSQWITGEAARADGHAWRKRAGAVLTGIGTLLEDDPRLDVRLVPTARQPLRVLIDSRLEAPVEAKLLAPPGQVLIYAAVPNEEREAALRGAGAEVAFFSDRRGKVELADMLADLGARGINELHVEAGNKLNGSLLKAGLVDELLVYLAPKLLGVGREMAAFGPLLTLADAMELEFRDIEPVGRDLRILARAPGRGEF
ncbi:bifunctional diaminohydroxyphosphoribosylaminopyrimidine deaminase/5-amino-6-(5-phosphoribosylamino)uracil reductase RibD [Azohydromonas aeria]|uniref:bifunctional diaminohydroxyphosphoribosylaminopyrimidine deaminase/5-amino-6-(5-phosphoribosylamino)uracil reductase RibD n=1 Tax=Azohydromonas aeria TaxID=2590212 RepID=UPI001E3C1020|nr:bifunctional diaminohydroxyphosphoribosylaminopyrimidine deaminase/5-amino-6-(5-phosphoribosylamino)uracil reductase RibD [Azohydromonas aeria]